MNLNTAQLVFAGVMGALMVLTGLALKYTKLADRLPRSL